MHNNNVTVNVGRIISEFFNYLIDIIKQKCCSIRKLLMDNSIAIMSACNPEIMEDVFNTRTDEDTR